MRPPILVTGAARSGTSFVAGALHHCGAWGGNVLGATPHNRRGQFENRRVVQEIVKPYLRLQGYDPLCQEPLPDIGNLLPFDNLRQRVEAIMREDGYPGGPWYYKGAKMCLLWPLWAQAFPRAKWVVVRRRDADIVASCMRTGFMKNRSTPAEWRDWVEEHKRRFAEMCDAGLTVREVWPERFIVDGAFTELENIVEWCGGLEWRESAVRAFVSPALWNGGKQHGKDNTGQRTTAE